jgi:catechol 2,3-dioxygenase-like lactoylglutathione lyase family enzyme
VAIDRGCGPAVAWRKARGRLAARTAGLLALLPILPWLAADSTPPPAVVGLDHVIVAVGDLEAAAARYRALGFSLKPGRPHDNGIRNEHVKFPDGVELELLTAPAARDELTAEYRRHLEGGDGPAFAGFFAPDRDRVNEGRSRPTWLIEKRRLGWSSEGAGSPTGSQDEPAGGLAGAPGYAGSRSGGGYSRQS